MPGKLYVVGLPIGNLEDITIRAINILKSVDFILCEDTREFVKIAKCYDIKTKTISFHDFNEKSKTNFVISALQENKNIALTSDRGTPSVSDPGFFLIKKYTEILKNNISGYIVPIPGASAPIIAQSICTLDNFFTFIGFAADKILRSFQQHKQAMIFFEAPHRINQFFSKALENFGNRKVFIARELTKTYEEIYYTDLINAKITEPRGEFTIIIEGCGDVEINWKTIEDICTKHQHISSKDLSSILQTIYNIPKKSIYTFLQNHKT